MIVTLRLRSIVLSTGGVYGLAWLPFLFIGDPSQMVRLQFARSASEARRIVESWTPAEAADFAYLLGLDAVHTLIYAILLSVGAIWATRRLSRGAAWRNAMVGVVVGAGACDIAENIGLLVMSRGSFTDGVAQATAVFAALKMAGILVAGIYVLAGAAATRTGRRSSGADAASEAS